ncbi:MAG: MBL fold metallo-hydrolase [Thermoleophilia bacterium]
MLEPLQRDEAFLADVEAAPADPSTLALWWLGQSGFLVAWNGVRLLLDPYLSDTLTATYAATDRPHVRVTARVVDPAALRGIDVVTASHGHTDHLDPGTLGPVVAGSPGLRLVVPEAIRALAEERSGLPSEQVLGLDAGDSVDVAGVLVAAVPAAHETVERDEQDRCRSLGLVLDLGPWRVYHAGDTVRYDGMEELLAPLAVDVAILPINGRDPAGRAAGNLDGPEAARLAHAIGARLAIPCHYGTFAFDATTPDAFATEAARLGQPALALRAGEGWRATRAAGAP